MKRERGFSLIELSITVAIFGVFLLILASLDWQLRKLDRGDRVKMMAHPENISVLTRFRRDTLDSSGYPAEFQEHVQTPMSLILSQEPPRTVVWTFEGSRATRREYSGTELRTSWTANAVPRYRVSSFEMPDGKIAVRLQGRDAKDRLTVDEILQPRAQ